MIIAGLDLSLTSTGVATEDGLHTVTSTSDDGTLRGRHDRLELLADSIVDHCHLADLVVIEGPAFSRTNGKHHDRSGLWWLVVARLWDDGHTVVEVSPTALKKFISNRGNATKSDVRLAIFQRAGLDIRDDNQADSWTLRQIGLHLVGDPDAIPLPRSHLVALDKVRTANPNIPVVTPVAEGESA